MTKIKINSSPYWQDIKLFTKECEVLWPVIWQSGHPVGQKHYGNGVDDPVWGCLDIWSHLIADLESRWWFDYWTLWAVCNSIITFVIVTNEWRRRPWPPEVGYMLCKDSPEYRPLVSCTIEAGLLNWWFPGIYMSRRLDELSSAVIHSEIMSRTPSPVQ